MSPGNQSTFTARLVIDFDSVVAKSCNIQLENSKAYDKDECEKIMKAVEKSYGFAEVNKRVAGVIRDWMVNNSFEIAVQRRRTLKNTFGLLNNVSSLLCSQAKFELAEYILRQTLN